MAYFCLADTIADFIGPHCEVVIHSFESFEKSVVKIVNGHHTGRDVGSPLTDLGLRMLSAFEKTGNVTPKSYFTESKEGALLKSTTCILEGEEGRPIGMFCINMNLSFPFPEIIKTLMPDMAHSPMSVSENFSASAGDVIDQALNQAIVEVEADVSITPKGKNKAITKLLFENGIFELKEATAIVSERLGITRHAIYKYLREYKADS
ncbi:Predicted transcriptional regulator YheO, contains PAS and DNA-binding HTH domains [Enterovibrio nigricans DSM 22720]|uniref:Predicted transcriptional regulator YheO, contains PAS and DNA-binding HTH domains n=2 Tax=Enterovibrio nigricans TaxID=504469 RepID=A0A1T4UKV1_9GAMM|nr:Predicted transcriptional regulator YheO, contains PAS and DNA-binding HTH domains [Enterovibrio nigricans DSM 22720]